MSITSRLDAKMSELLVMLESTPVLHLSKDKINATNLHHALMDLTARTSNTRVHPTKREIDMRRCIADVLLLLDGVDIHDKARIEARESGANTHLSIEAESKTLDKKC